MVKPQTTLVNTLDEYHSLDRFDSSRRDVIKAIVDEVFLVDVAYKSYERAYAYNADTRFRDGRSIYGSIANSEHQLAVQLPADMNEIVTQCSPGETIQVVLSPIKWDSAYDRLACIAVLDVEPVVDEAADESASQQDSESVNTLTDESTEEDAVGRLAEGDSTDANTDNALADDQSAKHEPPPEEQDKEKDDDDEIERGLEPKDEAPEAVPAATVKGLTVEQFEDLIDDANEADDIESPSSSIPETAVPDEQNNETKPNPVEGINAVEVEQVHINTQSNREGVRSADQDSRTFVIPHEDKKPWKQKADNFFKGLNIADMNKGLLLASGALVLISYGLMITCYILLCITAIYIIEDVNELGTKSRFPDKVYRIAKIELWAGAGMLAMIIASA
ncbi:MAG: hypothetical protein MK006_06620, partial [Pirellulales bacterium]|nr:hypothetical protein [Pirellulales bacterium]